MFVRLFASCVAFATIASTSLPAHADSIRDAKFLKKIQGTWRGPGEIVAGKYKDTSFTCQLEGSTPAADLGMALMGSCRVGVFSQKMQASVVHDSKTYKGKFLDGAAGEGLDITAGNVTNDRIVLTLKRKDLDGAMLARLASNDKLNVTISVRVGKELVPVIGMSLDRIDDSSTAAAR